MYKVCLVDDEVKNYRLFEKLVDWESRGFEIVGTAADGIEALQMYENLRPDLIFMDIQLPLMDGLECIRCIREEDKQVQIVIVSAYGDFAYAQKAIRYGVQDFLLKPVSRLMLNQLVDKMKKTLDEKAGGMKRADYYENELTEALRAFLEDSAQRSAPDVPCLCRIFIENCDGQRPDRESIDEMLEASGEKQSVQAVVHWDNSVYIMWTQSSRMHDALEGMCRFWKKGQYRAELYPWDADENNLNLTDFLKKALETENYGFYDTECIIYNLETCPFIQREIDTRELDGIILRSLVGISPEQIREYVEKVFAEAERERLNPKVLKNFALDVLLKIKFCLKKFDAIESFPIMRNVRTEKIYQARSKEALKLYVTEKIQETFENLNLQAHQAGKNGSVVLKANALAELLYTDQGFSVQSAADHIGISKNYFISLYKERTGTGFWEYVVKLRMEKAKELLLFTDNTVGAVASMVGYDSEYYFSRKFKEYAQMSPKQFQKNHSI